MTRTAKKIIDDTISIQLNPTELLTLKAICGETNISTQDFCRLAILHVMGVVLENKTTRKKNAKTAKPVAKKAPVKKATAKKATRKAVKKTAKKKAA